MLTCYLYSFSSNDFGMLEESEVNLALSSLLSSCIELAVILLGIKLLATGSWILPPELDPLKIFDIIESAFCESLSFKLIWAAFFYSETSELPNVWNDFALLGDNCFDSTRLFDRIFFWCMFMGLSSISVNLSTEEVLLGSRIGFLATIFISISGLGGSGSWYSKFSVSFGESISTTWFVNWSW